MCRRLWWLPALLDTESLKYPSDNFLSFIGDVPLPPRKSIFSDAFYNLSLILKNGGESCCAWSVTSRERIIDEDTGDPLRERALCKTVQELVNGLGSVCFGTSPSVNHLANRFLACSSKGNIQETS